MPDLDDEPGPDDQDLDPIDPESPEVDDEEPITDDDQEADDDDEEYEDDDEDDEGDEVEGDSSVETPPAESSLQPAVVRAGGQEFTIPGMMIAPEGAVIEKDHLDSVLSLIQRGRHHEMTWPQEQQRWSKEVERLKAINEVDLSEATAWTAEMQRITKDDDAMLAFIENIGHNLEVMKQRVASARSGKELEFLRQGVQLDQPATELSPQEFSQAAAQTLLSHFDQLVGHPEIAALFPAADRGLLWSEIASRAPSYVTTASQDMPELGVMKGEKGLDLDRLENDVRRLGKLRQGSTPAPAKPDRAKKINEGLRDAPRRGRRRKRAKGPRASVTGTPVRGGTRNDTTPMDRMLRMAEEE